MCRGTRRVRSIGPDAARGGRAAHACRTGRCHHGAGGAREMVEFTHFVVADTEFPGVRTELVPAAAVTW
ncbi:hypothetical protein [Pseudonocardia xishanensis]